MCLASPFILRIPAFFPLTLPIEPRYSGWRGPSLLPGAERHPAPSPPFSPLLIIFSSPVREYIVTTARPGNGEEIGTPALLRACPGISKKVLAESLRTLEADGLLTRTVLPGKPAPVEYALSALGRGLLPLFDAMAAWGEAYRRAAE